MFSGMESALGVPEEFARKEREQLTPMITQYVEICEEYDSELVLFHVGDFYKAFGEAAETVARLCELTLTSREDNTGEYKMAGLRVENAETHLQTLLDAGYRVAIAEQVEDPEMVSGVAARAVTRIITPGTLTESELLDSAENNYVLSITTTESSDSSKTDFGIAFLDVSTGSFYTTSLTDLADLQDEIRRIRPVEAILGPSLRRDEVSDSIFSGIECSITEHEGAAFQLDTSREKVASYFGPLQGSTLSPAEVRACGSLLDFAEYTRGGPDGELAHITSLQEYDPYEYMQLDDVALQGLELFERRTDQSPQGATLIEILDDCVSALGSRKLRDWLRRPLLAEDQIIARLDAVDELIDAPFLRESLRDDLEHVYDIERLSSRLARSQADARDIRALQETVDILPSIRTRLEEADSELLEALHGALPEMGTLRSTIDSAIKEDPAAELTEGGIIKEGYNDELDALRSTVRKNKDWIEDLEQSERERTGINNIRVDHNDVHGYYIEVTESHLDKVPEDYSRRQTLKNAERFTTPQLRDREDEIIAARQRAHKLEYEIFCEVREQVASETRRIHAVADALAKLDVLSTFAGIASANQYIRPEILSVGSEIVIEDGRHPVVEETQETFVPNDTELTRDNYLAVITGPNMSGKSTYLRQVALITILAQTGCFVPAGEARIGIRDKIYTRIGASDDITGGRSTFMVEMTEVADILEGATENSLILLDEVGRGTSTVDGYALACAVTKYIHNITEAMTLFATHHHELTSFIAKYTGAYNLHFSAEQRDETVIFHYAVQDGPAAASYGIEVAKEAGLPDVVTKEARAILESVDTDQSSVELTESASLTHRDSPGPEVQTGLMSELQESGLNTYVDKYSGRTIRNILEELEVVDVNETTPMEALDILYHLNQQMSPSSD